MKKPYGEDDLYRELERDEGFRAEPYLDTVNQWTIGIGRNLSSKGLSREELLYLFDHQPMTHDFALYLLKRDVEQIDAALYSALPWYRGLDDVRQGVLLNMGMMGVGRLLGFKRMLAAMENEDWETAARELLDSKYARQVGARAERLAERLRDGKA